jgi:hypothetical protein
MTDQSTDPMEHPDEGLIHAWLDDALSAAEAERLAAHVRTCAECRARVAEARGLIAGASRIVAALDDAPAGTRPGWAQSSVADAGRAATGSASGAPTPATEGSMWRWLRVTPGRAAIAATILVGIGITLTYDRAAVDSTPRPASAVFNPMKADMPAATTAEGGASEAAKPRDALLDSAIAKNVTIAQGRRVLEPARGPSVPVAPPPTTTLQAPAVAAAGEAVALGRATEQAEREAAGVAADRSRTKVAGAVASVPPAPSAAARGAFSSAAPVQEPATSNDAMMAKRSSDAVAKGCFLFETRDADARWADQPFPLVLAVDAGAADQPRQAAVMTPAGEPTELRAVWSPSSGDSVSIRLRRIGYAGSIVLGPEAGARSGIATSSVAVSALEQVAVRPSASARAESRTDARKSTAGAAPQSAPAAGPPIRQLHVTARSVACPAR